MNQEPTKLSVKILQISTLDSGGGAAKIPWDLHHAYQMLGHHSMLAVGFRRALAQEDTNIFEIPNDRFRSGWARFWYLGPTYLQAHRLRGQTAVRQRLIGIAEPLRGWRIARGYEDFDFPATRHLLELAPTYPDIIHCHNLHGGYFDLRVLPRFSHAAPMILTLHDMWLFTGHCAHSLGCQRWQIGCGQCPDLSIYPAVSRDATAENLERKRAIFKKSRLYISAPSHWLINQVIQSGLNSIAHRVIPHGLDLDIFQPSDKNSARAALGLPQNACIILFVASYARENRFKDVATIEKAIKRVAQSRQGKRIVFVNVGGRKNSVSLLDGCTIYEFAFRNDQREVARFYQAADIFIHAAHADTFPNTVLEALACGVPVVATAVGGIPEQITDKTTGFLVPHGDAEAMASWISTLVENDELRLQMSLTAAIEAKKRFDLKRQINAYLSWYKEICSDQKDVG